MPSQQGSFLTSFLTSCLRGTATANEKECNASNVHLPSSAGLNTSWAQPASAPLMVQGSQAAMPHGSHESAGPTSTSTDAHASSSALVAHVRASPAEPSKAAPEPHSYMHTGSCSLQPAAFVTSPMQTPVTQKESSYPAGTAAAPAAAVAPAAAGAAAGGSDACVAGKECAAASVTPAVVWLPGRPEPVSLDASAAALGQRQALRSDPDPLSPPPARYHSSSVPPTAFDEGGAQRCPAGMRAVSWSHSHTPHSPSHHTPPSEDHNVSGAHSTSVGGQYSNSRGSNSHILKTDDESGLQIDAPLSEPSHTLDTLDDTVTGGSGQDTAVQTLETVGGPGLELDGLSREGSQAAGVHGQNTARNGLEGRASAASAAVLTAEMLQTHAAGQATEDRPSAARASDAAEAAGGVPRRRRGATAAGQGIGAALHAVLIASEAQHMLQVAQAHERMRVADVEGAVLVASRGSSSAQWVSGPVSQLQGPFSASSHGLAGNESALVAASCGSSALRTAPSLQHPAGSASSYEERSSAPAAGCRTHSGRPPVPSPLQAMHGAKSDWQPGLPPTSHVPAAGRSAPRNELINDAVRTIQSLTELCDNNHRAVLLAAHPGLQPTRSAASEPARHPKERHPMAQPTGTRSSLSRTHPASIRDSSHAAAGRSRQDAAGTIICLGDLQGGLPGATAAASQGAKSRPGTQSTSCGVMSLADLPASSPLAGLARNASSRPGTRSRQGRRQEGDGGQNSHGAAEARLDRQSGGGCSDCEVGSLAGGSLAGCGGSSIGGSLHAASSVAGMEGGLSSGGQGGEGPGGERCESEVPARAGRAGGSFSLLIQPTAGGSVTGHFPIASRAHSAENATAFNSTKGVAGTLAQLAGLTKAQGRDEERQHQTAQDDTPDPNPMQGLNLAHLATLQLDALAHEIKGLLWIGQGGGGVVFRGTWQGATVAVKFMLGNSYAAVNSAALEAHVSTVVNHPNVVQTYGYDVTKLTERSFRKNSSGWRSRMHGSWSAQAREMLGSLCTTDNGGSETLPVLDHPGSLVALPVGGSPPSPRSGPRSSPRSAAPALTCPRPPSPVPRPTSPLSGRPGASAVEQQGTALDLAAAAVPAGLGPVGLPSTAQIASRNPGPAQAPGSADAGGPQGQQAHAGAVAAGGPHGALAAPQVALPPAATDLSSFTSTDGFGDPDATPSNAWAVGQVLAYMNAQPGMFLTHIIMEHCDRGSLLGAIQRGVFRIGGTSGDTSRFGHRVVVRALLRTARDVARGMQHLHACNIIHGDLKPGNVLLKGSRNDRRGFVAKVSDFGLAKVVRSNAPLELHHWSTITHMAPEVIQGRWLKASDVYSFGILLWQLVSGELVPYAKLTVSQILVGVAAGSLRPEWPRGALDALVKLGRVCLQHAPEKRPSFEDIANVLTKIELRIRSELRAQMQAAAAASKLASQQVPVGFRGMPLPHPAAAPGQYHQPHGSPVPSQNGSAHDGSNPGSNPGSAHVPVWVAAPHPHVHGAGAEVPAANPAAHATFGGPGGWVAYGAVPQGAAGGGAGVAAAGMGTGAGEPSPLARALREGASRSTGSTQAVPSRIVSPGTSVGPGSDVMSTTSVGAWIAGGAAGTGL